MTFPPPHKNPHRPYAMGRNRGKYPPSVTTVLGAMSMGDGLRWKAAQLTAEAAVDYPENWQHLDRDTAYQYLYKWHAGVWEANAEMGTIVHAVCEAWSDGEEADLEALVHEAATRERKPVRSWQDREAFVVRDVAGYVDGLEKFWLDYSPEPIGIEEVVRHNDRSHSYIGQRDITARLTGLDGVTQIDLKTTSKEATEKEPYAGLYFDKFRLQLAAYAKAEEIVHFGPDGTEVAKFPAYPIARSCVLSLRGDGEYQLLEVRAAGDEWGTFLRLVDIHHWVTKGCKTPAPKVLNETPLEQLLKGEAA